MSALSGAQHLAGSGRTSFPVDKALDRDAYRVLGYRQCGERAVRVDILERLADLIRPALAWRETSPGEKPAGAFDGRGFVVTQAMTSLTGSAGEDFASILRALGYRMERRPPLPPKPAAVEAPAAEAAPQRRPRRGSSVGRSSAADAGRRCAAPTPRRSGDRRGDAGCSRRAAAADADAAESPPTLRRVSRSCRVGAAARRSADVAAPLPKPSRRRRQPKPSRPEALPEQRLPKRRGQPLPTSAVAAATPRRSRARSAAAPELVEVWRPGGRSEERRPRHDRNRHRHHDRPAEGAQPRRRRRRGRRGRQRRAAPARTARASATNSASRAPMRRPRRSRRRPPTARRCANRARTGRVRRASALKARAGIQRQGQAATSGKFGGGRDKGGRDKGGRDRDKGGRDSGPSHRQYATSAAPRERERPVDPNSPFAKLAALKEQLTADRKDARFYL